MGQVWHCPRCSRPVLYGAGLLIARSGTQDVREGHLGVAVCLRCADVLWHRLRKVLAPVLRASTSVPGGNDAEETGRNPGAVRALPAR